MLINGACYIRVSTDEQTEYSPEAQTRLLREYACKNNILIADEHIYMDEGISGRKADKRPAFMSMIAAARAKPKPFDVILVHKFDRFARSREDSVVYKSLLKKEAGIRVVSITESIEDDKFSVILEAMLEAMAEYYSLNLADEVKKGMTEKARRGGLQSAPPFGYKAEGGRLVVIPEEAALVKFIFEQYAGREMGMRGLAVYLNDLGVKSHRQNKLEARSIEYILNNPVYTGKLRWTPTERARRNYAHPDTIISDGLHEPIIGVELWERVQERLRQSKALCAPRTKRETALRTWLKGLVRCGICGKMLTGGANGYFQCNGYSNGTCGQSACISIKKLERIVSEELTSVFTGALDIDVEAKQPKSEMSNELDLLTSSLKRLDFREKRIKLAFQEGIDTPEEYKANKKELTEERSAMLERLKRLTDAPSCAETTESLNMKAESIYTLMTDAAVRPDIKYKAAHFLIKEVIFNKRANELIIEYKK